ncbi:HEAT repeat domain-containing protein [Saccharibacillus sp. CPCC 101409]|uniref:HEAT repeat domain-containing protein n=1 Tax=Saccharibacillus sp. CPCC 101409 TaxID=3058041 RepID=UPI002673BB4F|nr:HEAT repeat domain-containing protein [Saccharibacillus sp. CPCC 101409]MDO3411934.1 HEAT repeat domain-containing protein [Saccharibacillus sp. CPCC 101409]
MIKQAQLERIVWKLKMAARKDDKCKEFGAARHRYRMNEPMTEEELSAFERRMEATLPAEFAAFLLTVGAGGAGPYYGIGLPEASEELRGIDRECRLYPNMPQDEWSAMTFFLGDPGFGAEEKKTLEEELYRGMLKIGPMGWTFEMMLVVTGRHRGRVVYIDRSHQVPFFTYEANFLEWYEHWLDEIIGGYDTGWFAVERRSESGLPADLYLSTLEEKVKVSAIRGMDKLPKLKPEGIGFLREQCSDASSTVRRAALEILAQKEYVHAAPFLERALHSGLAEERLNALRLIEERGEPGGGAFAPLLAKLLPLEWDARVFGLMTQLLERGPDNPLELLVPFFAHPDRDLRREAVFHAGRLPGREAYIRELGQALDDKDASVRETAVGALEELPNAELLPRYERMLSADADETPAVRRAVLRRLREFGAEAQSLLKRAAADSDPEIRREVRRILSETEPKVNKP